MSEDNERPQPIELKVSGIPGQLRTNHAFDTRWIGWQYRLRNATWSKVPVHPVTLKPVDATRPTNGVPFDRALTALRKHPTKLDGLGFILGEGIAGVDVDDCFKEDGSLDARGTRISDKFEDTYAEVSPSGAGFKVLVKVDPELRVQGHKNNGIEVYSERRYFCITGQRLNGHASAVHNMHDAFIKLAKTHGASTKAAPVIGDKEEAPLDHNKPGTLEDLKRVRKALRRLSADDYETWQKYAAAMRRTFRHVEKLEHHAFRVFVEWSSKSEKFNGEKDCRAKWDESDTSADNNPITIATILHDGKLAVDQNNTERGVGRTYKLANEEDWGNLANVVVYINGILTQGMFMLTSAPKMGKTYLALMLAYCLSNGLKVWDREVHGRKKVALLLLEEGDEFNTEEEPGRMHPQDRIKRRLRDMGYKPNEFKNVTFVYEIPPISDNGLEFIEKIVETHDVTFIDSMAMLRAGAEERRELGIWNRDYEFVKPIQRIASKLGKAVIMLAHAAKGSDIRDAMDAVSGTQGLQAGVDAMWILQRADATDRERVRLFTTGRDIPTLTHEIRWDGELRQWVCMGLWLALGQRARDVLELLLSEPYARRRGFTYPGIGQTIGVSEANARQYAATLLKYELAEVVPERPGAQLARGRPTVLVRAAQAAYVRAGRGEEVDAVQRTAQELL